MPTGAIIEPSIATRKLFAYAIVDGITDDMGLVYEAELGDVDALARLAGLYYDKNEYTKAISWYTLAAQRNHLFSQVRLGHMHHTGLGRPKSEYDVAFEYYYKAYKNGSASATNNIGCMYAKGHGVPKDDTRAMQWYQVAANMGSSNAQYNLGIHYENGTAGQANKLVALYYYEKSAANGFKRAKPAIKRLKNQGYYYFTKQRYFDMENHINKQAEYIKEYEKINESLRAQLKESEEQKKSTLGQY